MAGVKVTAALLACILVTPAQLVSSVRWSEANVEVKLRASLAHTDTFGHADTYRDTDSEELLGFPGSVRDTEEDAEEDEEDGTLRVAMDARHYRLRLTPTSWLVAPGATLTRTHAHGRMGGAIPLAPRPCLYLAHDLFSDDGPVGTLSLCHPQGPLVMLLIGQEVAELVPVEAAARSRPLTKRGHAGHFTHVVKRQPLPGVDDEDCHFNDTCGRSPLPPVPAFLPDITQVMIDPTHEDIKRSGPPSGLKVELGLFLDQALLEVFNAYLATDEELVDLVLGLVNNVQALFRHPSLGRRVDITITHLRLLSAQPEDLPTHRGDRIQLLKAFCDYSRRHNDPDDANPGHWDIGVYLSGLNFITQNPDGSENGVTMGLAYTGGVCKPALSCVINELGVSDYRGRPYPSAGALSSYVLAHEIGHSLGLRHDGVSNECASKGYIMAAGRGLKGATTWSSCAREMIMQQQGSCLSEEGVPGAGWDHAMYRGLPGQRWDAVAQCQLFLRDKDATLQNVSIIHEVCDSVQCRSPHRISIYLAGPALEGTHCGGQNWCRGGKCVSWGERAPGEVVAGGWGAVQEGECQSGCVEGGTGWLVRRRACDNPRPKNSVVGCVGPEHLVSLCPDEKVCGLTPRRSVGQLADQLCAAVAAIKHDIRPEGLQMAYDPDLPWQACALYCRKTNSTNLWTPRYEFKDDPLVASHLPDGTPCHGGDHVCLNRVCVPKDTPNQHRSDLDPHPLILLPPDPTLDYPSIDLDDLFQ